MMRGPTSEERLKMPPPELRMSSKTVQAYLHLHADILTGAIAAGQALVLRQVEEQYQINNTSTQILLMRLANEGLVQVLPIKERSWPNNAAFNHYQVTDLSYQQRRLASREGAALPDLATSEQETLLLKIQYADAEIALLLGMATGERVICYRERLRTAEHTVTAIIESYLPFWFAEMLPELERQERNLFVLIAPARRTGRRRWRWCRPAA